MPSKLRKDLVAKIPKQPRERPHKAGQTRARRIARQKQRVADLFEHRHLFVGHHLTVSERKLLLRLTRGLPQLRTVRAIMEEVYRLFDRRCTTQTALGKLRRLRGQVRRFKALLAFDQQCGRARKPPLPQGAEEHLQRKDEAALGAAAFPRHATGAAGEGPEKNLENLASVESGEALMALLVLQSQNSSSFPAVPDAPAYFALPRHS